MNKRQSSSQAGWKQFFRQNQRLTLLIALLLVAVVLLVVFLVILPQNQLREAVLREGKVNYLEKRELPPEQAGQVYPLQNHLLLVSPEEVRLTDYAGRQLLSVPVSFNRPTLSHGSNWAVIGDRAGTGILAIRDQEMLFQTELDGTFAKAVQSPSGYFAILDEKSGANTAVQLLKADGNRVLTLSFASSGNPVNLAFTPDGRHLDILLLNTASSSLKSILRRYDLEGKLLAQKELEGYNSLFYGLKHQGQDQPLVYSPTFLLDVDYASEAASQAQEFSSILSAWPVEDQTFVFANTQSDLAYSLYAFRTEGGLEEKVSHIGKISLADFNPWNHCLYYAVNNMLYVYSVTSDKLVRSVSLDGEILDFCFLPDGSLNVITTIGASLIAGV